MLASRISERTVTLCGGCCFLVRSPPPLFPRPPPPPVSFLCVCVCLTASGPQRPSATHIACHLSPSGLMSRIPVDRV
jgi:hypothetical protein